MQSDMKANELAGYVEHAEELNKLAKYELSLESRDATYLAKKISLGLSLQAIELAVKGILLALGQTKEEIRRNHPRHNLQKLLQAAEEKLQARSEPEFQQYHHFTRWSPVIDGIELSTTVAAYFEEHFRRGSSAESRSYFYPDTPVFTAPKPIQAICIIADYLIRIADEIHSLAKNQ